MQEKAESDKAFMIREKELKMTTKEEETKAAQFQAMFTQQQSFLQAMTQQQTQQQQQNQHERRNAASALQQFTFMVAQRLSVCKAVLVGHSSRERHISYTARQLY